MNFPTSNNSLQLVVVVNVIHGFWFTNEDDDGGNNDDSPWVQWYEADVEVLDNSCYFDCYCCYDCLYDVDVDGMTTTTTMDWECLVQIPRGIILGTGQWWSQEYDQIIIDGKTNGTSNGNTNIKWRSVDVIGEWTIALPPNRKWKDASET